MKKIILILTISVLFLMGCTGNETKKEEVNEKETSVEKTEVIKPILISPEDAHNNLSEDNNILLLDVRTKEEYDAGHIKGAEILTLDTIETNMENIYPDKDRVIYVYCRSGRRSAIAADILVNLGYKKIYDLGGIINWKYEVE